MAESEHIRIAAELSAVGDVAERVRDIAGAALGRDRGEAMELAFVEAANNVILHGYRSRTGDLDILISADETSVTVELQDRGDPMPEGALQSPAELDDALAESSRGIFLIHALVDDARYRTIDGVNHLTLILRS